MSRHVIQKCLCRKTQCSLEESENLCYNTKNDRIAVPFVKMQDGTVNLQRGGIYMEVQIGLVCALLSAVGILISALLIRRSKKWIIATILCSMLTLVFILYSVLTLVLMDNMR